MANSKQQQPPISGQNSSQTGGQGASDKESTGDRGSKEGLQHYGEHGGGERRGQGYGGEAKYGDLSYSNPGSDVPPFTGTVGGTEGLHGEPRDFRESTPQENPPPAPAPPQRPG